MGRLIGFVITAGHLDIEWYQPMRSYRFWTMEIMEDLKRIAKERSDFKCYLLDGQVFPLEEHLRVVPEDEPALLELVRRGLLAIGPFYTQFDEWLPSAESIIRNCLYGRRRSEAYGGTVKAGYLPDNFGHPAQLPQILRGFGMDSLMFMRGMPEVEGGHPDEFIYKGIDGTEVLASHFRESYGGAFELFDRPLDPIQPRDIPYHEGYLSYEWHRELAVHDNPRGIASKMIENVKRIENRYPSGVVPLISGYDHLPPQDNIGECVRLANEMQDEIRFIMGNPEEYAGEVRKHLRNAKVYDMELLGSRYHYILMGTLSTRAYLKRQHFAAEALLERYAEPLAALASIRGYKIGRHLFDEAWTNLMTNSAHDSIHGSSVDEVHVEMEARYAAVRQIASGLIHGSLKHLAAQLKPWRREGNRAVLTYSPVGSEFLQPCECWLAIGQAPAVMVNAAGRKLPIQVLERDPVQSNAIGLPRNEMFPLPPFRKALFLDKFGQGEIGSYTCLLSSEPLAPAVETGDSFLENEFLRVEICGALINILDKRSGHWTYGLNLLEEEADAGDAWDYSPPWVKGELVRSAQFKFACRLAESGPVRSVIEMRGMLNVPDHLEGDIRSAQRAVMETTFRVAIYAGIPRVDITMIMNNTARDHRIRLCVPMGIKSAVIKSQGHLAVIKRPIAWEKEIEPWAQPPTRLLPFREWIAADDGRDGLAIAFKGIYEYEAAINPLDGKPELNFTLTRGIGLMSRTNTIQRQGGASWAHPIPGAQCLGQLTVEWSYIPYQAAADDEVPFLSAAESFLYPPVAHAIRPSFPEPAALDEICAPIRWAERNIRLSAFKNNYDSTGYILRAYENQGKAVTARFYADGFAKAYLTDMNEEILNELTLAAGAVDVKFEPYKCLTLLFVR